MARRNERVVGHLKAAKLFSNYTLFFTNRRVIVAKTTNVGHFLAAGVIGGMMIDNHKAKKLAGVSPREILASHKDNYYIPYSKMDHLYVKKATTWGRGKIEISSPGEDVKFDMANKGIAGLNNYDFEFLQLLSSKMPTKVTVI